MANFKPQISRSVFNKKLQTIVTVLRRWNTVPGKKVPPRMMGQVQPLHNYTVPKELCWNEGKITGNGQYQCYERVPFSCAVSQLPPGMCRQQVLQEWSFHTLIIIPLHLQPQHPTLRDSDGPGNICLQDRILHFPSHPGFLDEIIISEVFKALGVEGGWTGAVLSQACTKASAKTFCSRDKFFIEKFEFSPLETLKFLTLPLTKSNNTCSFALLL